MKSQIKKFAIIIPIYNNFEVTLKVGETVKECLIDTEQRYKIDLSDSYNSEGFALTVSNDETKESHYIIHLTKKPTIVTIVHECLHMSWFVLGAVGVKVKRKNHEALAYLQSFMYDQIADIYNDMNAKEKARKKKKIVKK